MSSPEPCRSWESEIRWGGPYLTNGSRITNDLLRTAQVHQQTGIPVATLRWWRHRGEGPSSFKRGRTVFYDARDAAAWVDAPDTGGTGFQRTVDAVGGVMAMWRKHFPQCGTDRPSGSQRRRGHDDDPRSRRAWHRAAVTARRNRHVERLGAHGGRVFSPASPSLSWNWARSAARQRGTHGGHAAKLSVARRRWTSRMWLWPKHACQRRIGHDYCSDPWRESCNYLSPPRGR